VEFNLLSKRPAFSRVSTFSARLGISRARSCARTKRIARARCFSALLSAGFPDANRERQVEAEGGLFANARV